MVHSESTWHLQKLGSSLLELRKRKGKKRGFIDFKCTAAQSTLDDFPGSNRCPPRHPDAFPNAALPLPHTPAP